MNCHSSTFPAAFSFCSINAPFPWEGWLRLCKMCANRLLASMAMIMHNNFYPPLQLHDALCVWGWIAHQWQQSYQLHGLKKCKQWNIQCPLIWSAYQDVWYWWNDALSSYVQWIRTEATHQLTRMQTKWERLIASKTYIPCSLTQIPACMLTINEQRNGQKSYISKWES